MKPLQHQDIMRRIAPIMAAGRAVHAAVDQLDGLMRDGFNLQPNELRCLNALEFGPLTPSEIGERTGLTSGAVTALVDRLESRGYVLREKSEHDRRSVRVSITPEIHQDLGRQYGRCGKAVAEQFQQRSELEIQSAAEALRTFARALHQAIDEIRADNRSPKA